MNESPRGRSLIIDAALFLGVGVTLYVLLNPLAALVLAPASVAARHFVGWWKKFPVERRPFSTGILSAAAAIWAIPFGLGMVLNYMRPDLMQPMLDHVFGYVLVSVIGLLTLGGPAVLLTATSWASPERKVLVSLLASLFAAIFCMLPAAGAVLFGPIIFAFMFGNVSGGGTGP